MCKNGFVVHNVVHDVVHTLGVRRTQAAPARLHAREGTGSEPTRPRDGG